jgi:hypothetical protein
VAKIEVAMIAATSPTLAKVMRLCALRSGLSRSQRVRPYVLGHPKAWLGTRFLKATRLRVSVVPGAGLRVHASEPGTISIVSSQELDSILRRRLVKLPVLVGK